MLTKLKNKLFGKKIKRHEIKKSDNTLDELILQLPNSPDKIIRLSLPFKCLRDYDDLLINKSDLEMFLKSNYGHVWNKIKAYHEEHIYESEIIHKYTIFSYRNEIQLSDKTTLNHIVALRSDFSYVSKKDTNIF